MEPSSFSGPTHEHSLRSGTLNVWDAIAQAVAMLSPAMAVAFNTSFAASEAGAATPLSFLIAGLGSLALAYVVVLFTRRMSHAGYVYAYVRQGFGPTVGFVSGWIYAFSVALFVPMTMSGVAMWTSQLLESAGIAVHWFMIYIVGLVILFFASYFDIRLSTRGQLVFAFLSMFVILILSVMIVAKGGAHGNSMGPFSVGNSPQGWGGIFYGLIYAMTSYIGFESAAVLAEETLDPKRTIPRSIYATVLIGLVFYLFNTYAISIGFGTDQGAKWAQDSAPLSTLALQYSGKLLNVLISLAAILSALLVSLACHNATTRVMYAMGRDGALPRIMGRTHAVHKTPHVAIVVDLIVALLLGGIVGFASGPSTSYGFFGGTGSIGVILIYLVMSLAGIAYFRRAYGGEFSVLKHVVVPLVSFVVFALAMYGSVWPVPAPPYNLMPYVILAWLVIGAIVVGVLKSRDPQKVDKLGELLGEEGEVSEET
ncbi:MAG TPA: APC family permease [Alicyclobacillus sp.]|nr:APC family permease [Alicyclobacillus sp.]